MFKINSTNLSTYKIDFLEGTNEALLQPPTNKDRYTHDWGDSNGVEYYTSEVLYKKPQNITIQCIAYGTSEANAVANYQAFITLINVSGGFLISSDKLVTSRRIFYNSGQLGTIGRNYVFFSINCTYIWS